MEQSLFILALQTKQPVAALKTELMCSPYKIRRLNSVVIQRHKEYIETSGGFRKEPHHATEYSKEEKNLIFHWILVTGSVDWGVKLGCPQQLMALQPPRSHVSARADRCREVSRRKFQGKINVMTICKKFTAEIMAIYKRNCGTKK